MTYVTLAGVRFKVFSPSRYELDGANAFIKLVTVSYFPRQWWIDVLLQDGTCHSKGPFRSRDAAINVIANGTMERSNVS